jgi:HEAT repeat protein
MGRGIISVACEGYVMEPSLYELLRQCTVRVSSHGMTGYGTGFFVAPGLVLTSAHVVQAVQVNKPAVQVSWQGSSYEVLTMQLAANADLALVQIDMTTHPCVFLDARALPGDGFYSYGYSDEYIGGDPATFTCEGWGGERQELLKFKVGQVRPGFSGAPLLNTRTGYVCGIIQRTRDRSTDLGGRAAASSVAFREFPTLRALQQTFHEQDQRWNACQSDVMARLKYLKHIQGRSTFITLPLGPVEGLSLRAVFQPLTLRRDPVTAEDRQREERRHFLGEPAQVENEPRVIAQNGEDALAKSPQNRIIVLGGPGTGKTTLLQSLISERTQQALVDLTASVPILLSLPDLARSGKTLPEYLVRLIKEAGLSEHSTDLLWRTIEEGQAFVCLDSLDEVAPRERPEIIRLINELAARPGNTWVVGSRFTEYKGGQFKRGQFAEWELLPLDYEMRQHLALRLLPELYRLLPRTDASAVPEPAMFVQRLEYHQRAAAWGENPLLFSLAATVFTRTGTLPTGLAALYQQVIDAVLEMREPDPTRRKMLQRAVAGLALELYRIKGRTFTRDDIVTLMPAVRQREHENWSTEEMVNRIVASGLLDVVAQETYGFRHQTFQEYLAAVELAQRLVSQHQSIREEGWSFAWSKRTYSRWTEILRLMVGVLIQKHWREGAQLIRHWLLALVRQQGEADGDIGNLGLSLALESLAEVSGIKTRSWKEVHGEEVEAEVIISWITALFAAGGAKHQIQQQRLQGLGQHVSQLDEPAVKLAVEQLSTKLAAHDGQVRQSAVHALGMVGHKYIPTELWLDLLHDKDKGVRNAAVLLLGDLGGDLEKQVPIDALLSALSDESSLVRLNAASMLVYRREQAPMPQLMQLLHTEDWRARASAARILAQLGVRVPAEPFLADLHESNEWERRQEAFHVLATLGSDAPIELLFAALGDEVPNVRNAAAYALGDLKAYVPVERLVSALNDSNQNVRIAALEALGRREDSTKVVFGPTTTMSFHPVDSAADDEETDEPGDPRAQTLVEPVLKMLQDKDEMVRIRAAEVLEKLGKRVPVEPLVAALDDESISVRVNVVKALGNVRVGVPVEPLLNALSDEYHFMRQAAAEALVKMGVRPSEEFLLKGIKRQLTWIRDTALQVLWSMCAHVPIEVFNDLLNNEDSEVRVKAAKALGQFGERAPLEPLLAALQDEDVQVRVAAAESLGKFGERVPLEPLLRALNDETLQVREEVARTLGELGECVPLEPFLEALSDERASVRAAAADVLGELGTRAPLEPLLSALSDPDPSVRSMVVWALGEQGEHIPIEALVTALKDEDASVRRWAIWTLGELGSRAPIEPLIAALQDESEEVRSAVIWALGELVVYVPLEPLLALVHNDDRKIGKAAWQVLESLGQPLPAELLVHALNDADKQVRATAIKAIRKLDESIPVERLLDFLGDEDWDIRSAAKSTLSKLVESVPIELLLEALRSKQSNIRAAAVELLGLLKGQVVVDALLAIIHDDYDWHVKVLAAKTLGNLGILSSIEWLFPILHEGQQTERWQAAMTLGELGDRSPIEPLLAAIDDEDGTVRMTVVEALGKLGGRVPFEPLVAALGDSEQQVREAALKALRQTHSEALLTVVPNAIAIVQGGEPGKVLGSMLQAVVADGIGNTGSSSPILLVKLTQLLEEPYWEVRMKAVQALGRLRRNIPDAAIRRLLELRHDPQSRTVRLAANDALEEILSLETGIEDD